MHKEWKLPKEPTRQKKAWLEAGFCLVGKTALACDRTCEGLLSKAWVSKDRVLSGDATRPLFWVFFSAKLGN